MLFNIDSNLLEKRLEPYFDKILPNNAFCTDAEMLGANSKSVLKNILSEVFMI